MSCLNSSWEGGCNLFEKSSPINPEGCDLETGTCWCEEDPSPADSCSNFECITCCGNGCEECSEEWEE